MTINSRSPGIAPADATAYVARELERLDQAARVRVTDARLQIEVTEAADGTRSYLPGKRTITLHIDEGNDMTATGHYRGHIEHRDDVWVYADTGEPVAHAPDRRCGHCGLASTPEGHDGCTGELPPELVMNACCGHGQVEDAYIQDWSGECVRGDDALWAMADLMRPPVRCACVDVDPGTYANSIALYPPPALGITRVPVTVDRCIAEEVVGLWSKGIVTAGNCCGHNKATPMICVGPTCVEAMRGLGYTSWPGRPDHFFPRSLAGPSGEARERGPQTPTSR